MQVFVWQDDPAELTAYVDSDWAGDRATRKSTSGGMIFRGYHLIKSWSSNQQIVALSSGEAELYVLTQGAAQTLGIVSMTRDLGEALKAVVKSDSSAALAISQRVGLGKVRHLEVQYLWIQERHSNKQIDLRKVKGEQNPADMLTKGVPQEILCRHLATAGFERRGGRGLRRGSAGGGVVGEARVRH